MLFRSVREDWAEAVVVDAFAGAQVPDDLVTAEAWTDVRRVAGEGALVVLNIDDRAPFARTRRVLAGMRQSFPVLVVGAETATWRGRRAGNLLLVAGARPPGGSDPAYRWISGDTVSSSLGGGVVLTDP